MSGGDVFAMVLAFCFVGGPVMAATGNRGVGFLCGGLTVAALYAYGRFDDERERRQAAERQLRERTDETSD